MLKFAKIYYNYILHVVTILLGNSQWTWTLNHEFMLNKSVYCKTTWNIFQKTLLYWTTQNALLFSRQRGKRTFILVLFILIGVLFHLIGIISFILSIYVVKQSMLNRTTKHSFVAQFPTSWHLIRLTWMSVSINLNEISPSNRLQPVVKLCVFHWKRFTQHTPSTFHVHLKFNLVAYSLLAAILNIEYIMKEGEREKTPLLEMKRS